MDSSGLITLRSLIFSFLFRSKYEGYKAARPIELSPTFHSFDAQPGTPVFSMPFYRHQSFRGRDTTEQFPAGGVWVMNLWNWKAVCFPSPPPFYTSLPVFRLPRVLRSRVDHRGRNNAGFFLGRARTSSKERWRRYIRRLLLFLPAVSIFDSGEKEWERKYGGNIMSQQFRRCTLKALLE